MADRTVRAVFEVQVDGAKRAVRGFASDVGDADKKVSDLARSLAGIDKTTAKPKIDIAIEAAQADVDRFTATLNGLGGQASTVEVNADIARAETMLAQAQDRLDALQGARAELVILADTAQAERALGGIDSQRTQVDGSRAEIVVTADTSEAEEGADSILDRFGGLGDQIGGDLGSGITDALGSLGRSAGLAGVAATVGQIVGGEILRGIENELAEDIFAGATGMDEATAVRAGEAAGNAWASGWGESEATNDALLSQAFRAGLIDAESSTGEMEDILARLAGATQAWGADSEMTIRAVSSLIRSGLVADTTEAFDLIYSASQSMFADDILDTAQEYSTVLTQLGLDGESAFALIDQAMDNGARNTDQVADAMKELGLRAREGTDTARQAFTDLGLDADEMVADFQAGGPQAAAAMDTVFEALRTLRDEGGNTQSAITNLFGGPGEDMGAALFAMDLDEAVEAMGGLEYSAGTADKALGTMSSNATSHWDTFKRSAQQGIGDTIDLIKSGSIADWFDVDSILGSAGTTEDAVDRVRLVIKDTGGELDDFRDKSINAGDAEKNFAELVGTSTKRLEEQADALQDVIDLKAENAGNVIDAAEAEGRYHEAVREANAALAENGATLDQTTEAGLANLEALNGIAESAWDQSEALSAVGTSADEIQAQMQTARDGFIATAESMGMTHDEAVAYADQLGLIPENITTTTEVETEGARTGLRGLVGEIDGAKGTVTINGKDTPARQTLESATRAIDAAKGVVTIDATDNATAKGLQARDAIGRMSSTINVGADTGGATKSAGSARSTIDNMRGTINVYSSDAGATSTARAIKSSIDSMTAVIKVRTSGAAQGGLIPGGVLPGKKDGGWVPGPRSATDNVDWPVRLPGLASGGYLSQPLRGGEFVVNPDAAAQNAALLVAINSGRQVSAAATSSFDVSLVGARAELGRDGLLTFVDGRIVAHAQSQALDLAGRRTR